MNEYAGSFGKETKVVKAANTTIARTEIAKALGIPTSHEWRIKLHQIDHRVSVNFKVKKDD